MFSLNKKTPTNLPLIGVGLRHNHFEDALNTPANIDFIEVHAENFFANGGASHAVLTDISQHYKISLHATSLGLGSALPAPQNQLDQLTNLVERYQPILLSDHACFSWAESENASVHAGDLLPVPFNDESLSIMVRNVERAQMQLGRKILVENLSAYIELPGSTYSEAEFLVKLCHQSGCKLLVDLNNLIVNAINQPLTTLTSEQIDSESTIDVLAHAKHWLDKIPAELVGEIHLAGCTPVGSEQLMIDDHGQPVSDDVWHLYHYALQKFGPIATLIEWDENLPTWQVLIAEADKAKSIAINVFSAEYEKSDSKKTLEVVHNDS
ncbi:DUF692 domain-containing protein [Cognaticolwellia mytili]|uniref:DUF692 domain-containing protein n=1 Tax=Cognaticolwellia mytili TaxID=1888913 RepID=UPI000A1719DC|nr:DUF692 domain-containing protein [Cognaticolwellia mytili]